MKLTEDQKKKLAGVLAGTAGVCYLIFQFVISAQKATLAGLEQQIASASDKAAKAEREVKSTQQVQDLLQARTEQLQAIESKMASGDLFFWSVSTVNGFLEQHKKVSIPKFTKPTEGEIGILPGFPYKAATFSVEGSAHYEDFGRFVAGFENEFPYLRLQNIELSPLSLGNPEPSKDPEKLGFKMDVVALIKPGSSR